MRGAIKSLGQLKERMTALMMAFDPTWEAYPAFMLRVLHFRLGVRLRYALGRVLPGPGCARGPRVCRAVAICFVEAKAPHRVYL